MDKINLALINVALTSLQQARKVYKAYLENIGEDTSCNDACHNIDLAYIAIYEPWERLINSEKQRQQNVA